MKSRFLGLAAGLLLAVSGTAFAGTSAGSFARGISPYAAPDYGTPPPASVIVAHGGMEWIWAAPCSEGSGSCGAPSHLFGFDTPTESQWATWADRSALIAAFTDPNGGAVCGSPWMDATYSHCDYEDMVNGHIWHAFPNGICDPGYYNGCEAGTTESFLVRAVPEPQTYALMLAGLGLVGYIARRRQQRSA